MTADQFFEACGELAYHAGQRFNVNPAAILAVAAFESAHGTSNNFKTRKNSFGIKASTFFNKEFWDGKSRAASPDGGDYRIYSSLQNSFYDFAWLITSAARYKASAAASYEAAKFAALFTSSGYMTGNQSAYRAFLEKRIPYYEAAFKKKVLIRLAAYSL